MQRLVLFNGHWYTYNNLYLLKQQIENIDFQERHSVFNTHLQYRFITHTNFLPCNFILMLFFDDR